MNAPTTANNETLERIKNEVAREHFPDFEGWIECDLQEERNLWPIVSERFARAVALASLKEAAENGKVIRDVQNESTNEITSNSEKFWTFKNSFYQIDKSSITDEKNIKLL